MRIKLRNFFIVGLMSGLISCAATKGIETKKNIKLSKEYFSKLNISNVSLVRKSFNPRQKKQKLNII